MDYRNMHIATCNMHIAEFLCNMDTSSKPFLFRRKESIASRCIAVQYGTPISGSHGEGTLRPRKVEAPVFKTRRT